MNKSFKMYVTGFALFLFVLALDFISKEAAVENLGYHERIDYFGGFLRLSLTYNRGGVFGIMQGYQNMFLIVSVVVLIFMIAFYVLEKNKTLLFTVSMSLVAGGAVGNIIDRLMPSRPGVVDFISVGVDSVYRWPTFNVADSAICVGAFFLVIVFFLEEKRLKAQRKREKSQ